MPGAELGKVLGVRLPVNIQDAYEAESARDGIPVSTLIRRDIIRAFTVRSGASNSSTHTPKTSDSGRQIREMAKDTDLATTRPESHPAASTGVS